ncbi:MULTISPECIES: hypothetical protein [Streptomyces]|uniref:Uncharacterized protein n=1 Tax=Streptomyces griseiscabiei TaxID=2993540 RepID=A0ABU4LDL8_9ACTN|nr:MULTISPECIES: hypothetical protein [Streptomyces]MBZ3908343.1 hypothetical protein [Streptomyces griseiscabiei]MDX2913856.1 hypothetical protein [Streptomyces griseiscabiei]
MSYIRFQDLHGSTHLKGHERHWILSLLRDHAQRVLLEHPDAADRAHALFDLLPRKHELREVPPGWRVSPRRWMNAYARTLQDVIFDDPIVDYRGHRVRPLTLTLNTAMETGPDPLRLATRLTGQCELNTWVDGPHRSWLAGVVAEGLREGYFREACGWEDLQSFLLARDDQPVVVSVSESFPTWWTSRPRTPEGEDLDEDAAEQRWEALTTAEQWARGMESLRSRTAEHLEMTPDWADYRFGSTLSLNDLLAPDCTRRLDHAFELTG